MDDKIRKVIPFGQTPNVKPKTENGKWERNNKILT